MRIFAEVVIKMNKGFEMGLTEVDAPNRPGQPNVIVGKMQNRRIIAQDRLTN